jgi:hypothetical protein
MGDIVRSTSVQIRFASHARTSSDLAKCNVGGSRVRLIPTDSPKVLTCITAAPFCNGHGW